MKAASLYSTSEHSENLIESRVEAHDSQQFEVKLDYSIDPNQSRNEYQVEAYMFVPKSLGINRDTYSTSHFFRDMHSYIRFKTPPVALKELLSSEFKRSPFIRLGAALKVLREDPGSKKAESKLTRELKLLACLTRANMRDSVRELIESLPTPNGDALQFTTQDEEEIVSVLHDIKMVFEAYRALKPELAIDGVSFNVKDTYEKVDEYLSLVLENHLTHLLEALDARYSQKQFLESRKRVTTLLENERNHRDAAGYPRILESGIPNEHYLYRRGLLKKMAMSVLFLQVSKEDSMDGHSDFVASIAAGVAMVFATLAAILAQTRYGLNTGPFVAALVVSYILKDRIKDWIKRYYSKFVAYRLWDRSIRIVDPHHDQPVGRCREQFEFLSRGQIPEAILKIRHEGEPDSVEARAKQEHCIRYNKEIRLDGKRIDVNHGRLLDINDIIRFNVWRMFILADDPKHDVRLFNVRRQEIETVECPKVYHLNILLRFLGGKEKTLVTSERVRVVLDRNGIRHLDIMNA